MSLPVQLLFYERLPFRTNSSSLLISAVITASSSSQLISWLTWALPSCRGRRTVQREAFPLRPLFVSWVNVRKVTVSSLLHTHLVFPVFSSVDVWVKCSSGSIKKLWFGFSLLKRGRWENLMPSSHQWRLMWPRAVRLQQRRRLRSLRPHPTPTRVTSLESSFVFISTLIFICADWKHAARHVRVKNTH